MKPCVPLGRDSGRFDRSVIDDPPARPTIRANGSLLIVIVACPVSADEMAFEAGQEPGAKMHAGHIGVRWPLVHYRIAHRILWSKWRLFTKCAFSARFVRL